MTDLSHDAADDGFHEIQLSGKQLVFLFMATTVVSVVIFLCGVLVGRSVRSGALGEGSAPSTSGASASSGAPTETAQIPDAPPPADGRGLSYPQRLGDDKPVPENLQAEPSPAPQPVKKAASEPATGPKTPDPAGKTTPAVPPAPAPTAAKPSAPPARSGVWAVQVVALTDRAAATAVVQRLSAKGYPAFIVSPQTGAPVQNYKVQVGKFDDRAEAEQIAGRLKKEEQFQPWILR